MIFPITMLCVAGCLLATYAIVGRGSSLGVGLWVWALAVALTAAPILDFFADYSPAADAMLGGALVAITAGYLVVRDKAREVAAFDRERAIRAARWLGAIGILGCLIMLLDAQRTGIDTNPITFFGRISEVREANFDRLYSGVGQTMLGFIGAFLAPAAFVTVILAAKIGRPVRVLGIVNFVLVTAVGLLIYGGRATPFFAALLAIMSWHLAGGRLPRPTFGRVLLATAAAVVVALFSVTWIQAREGSFSPEATLSGVARANYHPWVEQAARENETLATALVSVSYFSSPIPTFNFYLDQGPPEPLWGQYSFPLVYQLGGFAVGEPARPWTDVRREVFGPLEGAGYFGNVWATWLRDLVVEWGYLGALMFCALFGAFMAWARNRAERTGAFQYHALETLAAFTFAFGAFTSVMPFSFMAVAFFTVVALTAWLMLVPRIAGHRNLRATPARP